MATATYEQAYASLKSFWWDDAKINKALAANGVYPSKAETIIMDIKTLIDKWSSDKDISKIIFEKYNIADIKNWIWEHFGINNSEHIYWKDVDFQGIEELKDYIDWVAKENNIDHQTAFTIIQYDGRPAIMWKSISQRQPTEETLKIIIPELNVVVWEEWYQQSIVWNYIKDDASNTIPYYLCWIWIIILIIAVIFVIRRD
jgi:hypothetical protein